MSSPTASAQFLLLFRHPKDGPDPSPEEMQKIMGKWMAWMKGMGARGEFAGANRLDDTGAVIKGQRGAKLTDGPYAESKEIVGGYVIVNAASLAAATAIARGCPGLDNDAIVEVRPIEPLPPM